MESAIQTVVAGELDVQLKCSPDVILNFLNIVDIHRKSMGLASKQFSNVDGLTPDCIGVGFRICSDSLLLQV